MDPRIPRFDYRAQYHVLKAEIHAAVEQVLESGNLILGPHVIAFEEAMCRYLAQGGFAVGVGNGTDALAIALRALDISPGDEVITVANTSVATVSAIRMARAKPVFCDIDPRTLLMDTASAEKCIAPRTRAIIPVHLFGNAVNMKAIIRLAGQYGLRVIEDCAQSCGTLLDGQHTGTWGDIGCFSFYPTKNLAAYGDGGLCFTRNRALADAMREIRSYGCASNPCANREGVNSRLDELQAAILEIKLRHLPDYVQNRRRIAAIYRECLSSRCDIPQVTSGAEHSYHLFVIQTEHRERVCSTLRIAGIESGIHYPTPIHLMPAYRFLEYSEGSLPITEAAARRILSLPCYPEMNDNDIKEVCSVTYDALRN